MTNKKAILKQLHLFQYSGTSILLSFLFVFIASNALAQLTITAALCDNKINPAGVALQKIHFGWELKAAQNDQYQTAYQLVIASSKENLAAGKYDVYDGDMVKSKQSVLMEYKGVALQPAQLYYWKLRVWDKDNKASDWSNDQQFITGIFTESGWSAARWIGYEQLPDAMRVVPGVHEPFAETLVNKSVQRPVVPLFRKMFSITKKVKTALLFVTGLGQYELSLNGTKTGDAFLAPGWTYFDKTVLYNSYDVTQQLLQGNNAIGMMVGNGFYNINRERYFKIVGAFGMPTMICRLKITYEDGTTENIVSDGSWKTSPSPVTFSSIYSGEDYDARLEQEGWNKPAFDDSKWMPSLLVKAPAGKLLPEQDYPLKLMDSFTVKKITRPAISTNVYDFGQNISGIVRLKVKGHKGQQIRLYPAELVHTNQLANQDATGKPYYFTYTLKSDAEEIWQPRFTYYGFRYVQADGVAADNANNNDGLPVITEMVSLHNRNSNPVNGNFACSNPLFNRIYTLINWAIKSNMQSVITDCPHREKLSWLEQDYLMGNSIHYNFDVYHLYRKLVQDLQDAQYPEGFVPDIAPEYVVFEGGFLDSPEWGSSAVILPWLLYQWYGDKAVLADAYNMTKKYVDYLESKSNGHLLSHGLGDWFDYGPNSPGESQLTPKTVTATSIFYYDAVLVGKMAAILDNAADAAKYATLAAGIKQSFNKKYFNSKTKVYSTGSQTAMAMPFSVGLVDEKYKKAVIKNLVDSIYAGNKALTAGDIGFHFLVNALDKGGASQLLFDMNNRDDVPGYGFQLKKGATALTESWPALEDVSNNHLMLGHIMEWFYSGLAGIDQEEGSVAYQKIRIRPQPVGDVNAAKGSFHSPYGWITTDWRKSENTFSMQVSIPVNSSANIYLPAAKHAAIYNNNVLVKSQLIEWVNGMAKISVASGEYFFEVK